MPGEIQTSFIPKAPMTAPARPAESTPVGFSTIIGLVLLVSAVAIYVGAFGYKMVLQTNIKNTNDRINLIKQDMPAENLKEIERLNTSLNNAKNLLAGHVSANRIFKLLQDSTVPTVRYVSFNFSGTKVSVKGSAKSYEDIAAQAEVLKKIDAIEAFQFADFSIDPKTRLASFSLVLTVKQSAFIYNPTTN